MLPMYPSGKAKRLSLWEFSSRANKNTSNHSRHTSNSTPSSNDKPPGIIFGSSDETTSTHDSSPDIQSIDFGYSNISSNNSLGIFKRLGIDHINPELHSNFSKRLENDLAVQERYRSLVCALPSRPIVEYLTRQFFVNVNWYYTILDENAFADQLHGWFETPYTALTKSLSKLSAHKRSFPALVFQVLSLALQLLPPEYDKLLDQLKNLPGQTFDDIAENYSESGISLSNLLGKTNATLSSVQAGFLRSGFLKNSGRVTDAWHLLGSTIKDAYEIGLHRETAIESQVPEEMIENLWNVEMRRRLMMNLYIWDSGMAVVLGRPMTIDLRDCDIKLPTDTSIPFDRKGKLPFGRSVYEKPTSITSRLHEYQVALKTPELRSLQLEGPYPKDYSIVEAMHKDIVDLIQNFPATHRVDNTDTSWDSDCPWLRTQRESLCSTAWYYLLSVHRPYIFSIAESRREALEASLKILRSQERLFRSIEVQHHKMFGLVFYTFDASVLSGAVFLARPNENSELLPEALHCMELAISRLQHLSSRNALARSASLVLEAVFQRTKKIQSDARPSLATELIRDVGQSLQQTNPGGLEGEEYPISNEGQNEENGSHSLCNDILNLSEPYPTHEFSFDVNDQMAAAIGDRSNDSSSSLNLMADILFSDLAASSSGVTADSIDGGAESLNEVSANSQWFFEGDFPENSFWNFMNHVPVSQ
ncbi:MAG: hypothetical protein M1837_002630 [Sclerophora amabilis]|nr:MAG: hypothetical protein M1837_002630 [Sclerophora amabilis]